MRIQYAWSSRYLSVATDWVIDAGHSKRAWFSVTYLQSVLCGRQDLLRGTRTSLGVGLIRVKMIIATKWRIRQAESAANAKKPRRNGSDVSKCCNGKSWDDVQVRIESFGYRSRRLEALKFPILQSEKKIEWFGG